MTLDKSRIDDIIDDRIVTSKEPRGTSVPADTLDAIALLQASGAGSVTNENIDIIGNLRLLIIEDRLK